MKTKIFTRRIIVPAFIYLFILGLSACNKFLDIQPSDAVSDEAAIIDKASAENAVRGCYRALSAGGYYGSTFQVDVMLAGNTIAYTQSGASALQFLYHTLAADNNDLEAIWSSQYAVVNQANFVIAKVPGLNDASLPDAEKQQLLGEGYFIRALAYFDLARTFGGVQILLTPTLKVSDKNHIPRSSQSEVYAQALKDLDSAEVLLPNTTVRNRATRKTVYALRSRLYLYLGKWAYSEQDASKVIEDDANYKLVKPFKQFFTSGGTTESVFELSYSIAYPNPMFANWKQGGSYFPNDSTVALLKDPAIGGTRNALLVQGGTKTLAALYPQSNGTDPVYVIRIAELWLIRAEDRVRLGDLDGALSDLNKVRERAGIPDSHAKSASGLLLAIENERRVEFALEPQRWFDLVRTGRAEAVLHVADEGNYVFPIPTPELEADPSLSQNSGY